MYQLLKILEILSVRSRSLAFLMIPFFAIASISEAVGIMTIMPLIAIVTNQNDIPVVKFFIDTVQLISPNTDPIFIVFVTFIIGVIVASASRIAAIFFQQRVTHLVAADIAQRLFEKFIGFNNDDNLVDKSSTLVAMVTNKVDRVNHQLLLPIAQSIAAIFLLATFVTILILSLGIQPIIVLALVGVFYLLVYRTISKYLKKYSKIINRNQTNVVEATQEASQMFRELKVYGLANFLSQRFERDNRPLQRANANLRIINNAPRPLIDGFITVFLASFILYYYKFIGDVIELVPLIAAVGLMVARITPMMQQLFSAAASFRGGYDILKELVSYFEKPTKVSQPSFKHSIENIKSIELQSIDYSYDGGSKILENVNLKIESGKKIGIIGTSGSGKSTLLDIILGLRKPTNGSILVNGNRTSDMSNLLEQGHFSYVPQTVFLFNQSLKFNIALDHSKVADECLQNILDQVDLRLDRSLNLNTNMGELGKKVSGGQRQKVGIARALYHQGTVQVFDEVTSALDFDSEKEIVQLFHKLPRENNAYVFVTHRPAILSVCDQIYKLENATLTLI